MSLNNVLSIKNFREHSLFPMFLEEELEPKLKPTDDPTEYEIYECFLTYLEDNDYE